MKEKKRLKKKKSDKLALSYRRKSPKIAIRQESLYGLFA